MIGNSEVVVSHYYRINVTTSTVNSRISLLSYVLISSFIVVLPFTETIFSVFESHQMKCVIQPGYRLNDTYLHHTFLLYIKKLQKDSFNRTILLRVRREKHHVVGA